MTPRIGSLASSKLIQVITRPGGLNERIAALTAGDRRTIPLLNADQVRAQNVAAELVERTAGVQYPVVNVYCERVVNDLQEKFRSFSGKLQMAIEIRYSQDRLEGLQETLELYADAATQALTSHRGDWGDGLYYGGGYEVVLTAVKHGGKNFIQVAKVSFQIGVSRS